MIETDQQHIQRLNAQAGAYQARIVELERMIKDAIAICNDYSTGRRTIHPDITLEGMGENQRMIMHTTTQCIAFDIRTLLGESSI